MGLPAHRASSSLRKREARLFGKTTTTRERSVPYLSIIPPISFKYSATCFLYESCIFPNLKSTTTISSPSLITRSGRLVSKAPVILSILSILHSLYSVHRPENQSATISFDVRHSFSLRCISFLSRFSP